MSSNDPWKPGTPANQPSPFLPNIKCLELSSSHPFSAPISAWRAFSPRASLSFLARRTCGFKKPDAKHFGKHTKPACKCIVNLAIYN